MKVIVRCAESGQELEIAVSEEKAIDEIQESVYSSLGIKPEFQILLSEDGVSLKDKKCLPSLNSLIYAFSKEAIKKDKLPLNLDVNQFRSAIGPCLQGEERGVIILERKLHKLAERALKLTDMISGANDFKDRMQKEINICEKAANVLHLYHNKYIQNQINSYKQLYIRFATHYQVTQEELDLFDNNIERLGQIKLHDALEKTGRRYLSEILDIMQLTRWKEQFHSEIERLQVKFQEVNASMDQLSDNFKLNLSNPLTMPVILELKIISAQNAIRLYKEYRDLSERYIHEGDASAGERLHEDGWESKACLADSEISELERNSFLIDQSISNLKESRKNAADEILTLLKQVTAMSIKIRDSVKSQVNMLSSLLKRSEKRLGFVKVPRLLPEAYHASLVEISRRRLFVNKANELQQQLNKIAEIEIEERLTFLNKYRHVLPNDFVSQLSAAPCVRVISFTNEPDLQLPEIDVPVDDFQFMHLYASASFDEKLAQKYEDAVNDLKSINEDLKKSFKKEEDLCIKISNQNELITRLTSDINAKDKVIKDTDKGLHEINEYLKSQSKEVTNLKQQLALQTKKVLESALVEKQLKDVLESMEAKIKDDNTSEFIKVVRELGVLPETPNSLKTYVEGLKLSLHSESQKSASMISFTAFNEGSIALFFPTLEGHFLAFNFNCPNHFLDLDSLSPATLQCLTQQPYLVGHIISLKVYRAGAINPFSLQKNTEYALLAIQEMPL